MLGAMRSLTLLPLVMFAACTSGPNQTESAEVFADSSSAMASAQSRAVAAAQTQASAAPGPLTLNFSGPCTVGGTVAVTGTYDGSGTNADAAFDLMISFTACADGVSTLDGAIQWAAVASGTSFTGTETGSLDDKRGSDDWSCDFDLTIAVDQTAGTEMFS